MKIKIGGMSCGHCKSRIENALKAMGYTNFSVDLAGGCAEVEASEEQRAKIVAEIEDLGFDAE
ncbi:MAG: cation transporter [Bacillota bacterium]|nr:cation transporter [Bacillota bacterium]